MSFDGSIETENMFKDVIEQKLGTKGVSVVYIEGKCTKY
jgi:hypothetical protein